MSARSVLALLELEVEAVDSLRLSRHRDRAEREWQLRAMAARAGVGRLFDPLPASAVARIARAPLCAELAALGAESAAEAGDILGGWAEAEAALSGAGRAPRGLWTALGDFCFDARGAVAFAAPQVHGVVVDGRSPCAAALSFLPEAARAEARPVADLPAVAGRFRAALGLVERVQPTGVDLVLGALDVIVVHEQPGHGLSSSSSRRQAGVAAFGNPGGRGATIARLADALLHEAMHSALYLVERDIPFFPREGAVLPRLRSPWTGAVLPLHGFVHACCIWYELSRFWARAAAAEASTEARELCGRAAAGFAAPDLAEAVAGLRGHVTAAAWDLLREVCNRGATVPLPAEAAH